MLVGNIATFLEEEIRRFCEANTWEIGALNVQEDHVHLFLSAPPALAPSLMVHTLKGMTARHVFTQHPYVKKHLWGGFLVSQFLRWHRWRHDRGNRQKI